MKRIIAGAIQRSIADYKFLWYMEGLLGGRHLLVLAFACKFVGYILLLSGLILLFWGCSAIDVSNAVPFMAHPTTTKELAVSEAPDIAYDRAAKTIMAMGGVVTQLQPGTRRISAQLYGAVAFNVTVTPTENGSLLTVNQRVSDGYIAYTPVRACEQFFTAYHQAGR